MRRLVGLVHPAGQLDDAIADRPDIDGALGQDGIVAERFEHALFEHFVFLVHFVRFVVLAFVTTRDAIAELLGERGETAKAIGDDEARRESEDGAGDQV
jgi:hypothetical protein